MSDEGLAELGLVNGTRQNVQSRQRTLLPLLRQTWFSVPHLGGWRVLSAYICTLCRDSAQQNMGANSNKRQLFVIGLLWGQGLAQLSKFRLGRAVLEQSVPI